MYLLTAVFTIALFFGVFKILAVTMREYRHIIFSVIEKAELLDAIKAERARSPRYVRA